MFYLGVDGGGTKTAFLIIDDGGNIQARAYKPTIDYLRVGETTFRERIEEGISELCVQANIDVTDIHYSCLGIPGLGDEIIESVPNIEEIVRSILKGNRFICVNDVEVGWAGSLGCKPGIHLVAGTGAIGYGKDHNGNSYRASGWGHFCGDEGSAYWIGMKLINLYTRQSDGREARTTLYKLLKERLKLNGDFDLLTVLYNDLELQREQIAQLAKIAYEAATAGDKKAINIFKEAAYELGLIATTLMRELTFNEREEEVLISYSGGIFNSGEYVLAPLKEYLSDTKSKLIQPILEPITGAAMYALIADKKLRNFDDIIHKLKKQEDSFKG